MRPGRRRLGSNVCLAGLLAVFLAGCATGPRDEAARPPDWVSEDTASAPAVVPAPAPPPASMPTNPPPETWIPLNRWCLAHGLTGPCPVTNGGSPAYALSTTGGVLVLRPGSRSAYWEGLELRLGAAPEMMNGQVCLQALDLKRTVQPLLSGPFTDWPKTNLTVVIDPGHGGEDSGTKSVLGYHYEKDYTLDWALRLAALLVTNGWHVFLTRTNDTNPSLSTRVAFAEAHKADLFLSLHFNSSAPDERQAGLETYCLTPPGMFSGVTRGYGDDPAQAFPNNAFDAENLQLALRVHRALLQVNGRLDRGVRRARYLGVLRGQNRPAILVEGGYLSNPSEARRIADPEYRQRLAEAVAQGLE